MAEVQADDIPSDYRAVGWCFTQFNVDEPPVYDDKQVKFLLFGRETCPETQRKHLQGYIEFSHRRTFGSVKNWFGAAAKVHLERRRGTALSAAEYCKKGSQDHDEWDELGSAGPNYGVDADVTEYGTISKPGERSDILALMESIKAGKRKRDLYDDHEHTMFKFYKHAAAMIPVYAKPRDSNYPTLCWWFWGKTGCDKSRRAEAFRLAHDGFKKSGDNDWYDGYEGQKVLVIQEFDFAKFPFRHLLEVTDRYPMQVQIKGGFTEMCARIVIITSEMSPEVGFTPTARQLINRPGQPLFQNYWAQIERRFHGRVIDCSNVPYVPVVAEHIPVDPDAGLLEMAVATLG